MSTPEDTDTPENESGADEESAAGSARRGRPLSEAFTGMQRRRAQPLNQFLSPLWQRNLNLIKVPHFKTQVSPEILRLRATAERLNSIFKVPIPRSMFNTPSPAFREIAEGIDRVMRSQLVPALSRLSVTIQNLFPPNWGEARPRDWDEFEHMLAHEGIPVLRVPGPEIIAAIFAAKTPSDRRRVLSSRWKGIVTDCETVLNGVTHQRLADEREFALDCVKALRSGHTNAAQALAANLLDSVMRKFFSKEVRVKLTKNKFKDSGVTFDFDDFHFRAALTFAPVWCAHAEYWPDKGDPIPADYGRHPSAHAVSRKQYKRVNAVIALMLVTSVIKFFDDELKRRGS
ncbi:hypothetical protein E1287_07325 [Actinomadura sp. KC06]|uniref:hypothetical protein n=1 Tax=Actinomadura sp. KC06 TaxID=2530369 RepID=UPI0010512634|nr:hypothetical protein [Actinomadura sp. KC06]TDD37859.1 hypothetical protein E1287_07325 [Actinomadura sp. KC06]